MLCHHSSGVPSCRLVRSSQGSIQSQADRLPFSGLLRNGLRPLLRRPYCKSGGKLPRCHGGFASGRLQATSLFDGLGKPRLVTWILSGLLRNSYGVRLGEPFGLVGFPSVTTSGDLLLSCRLCSDLHLLRRLSPSQPHAGFARAQVLFLGSFLTSS